MLARIYLTLTPSLVCPALLCFISTSGASSKTSCMHARCFQHRRRSAKGSFSFFDALLKCARTHTPAPHTLSSYPASPRMDRCRPCPFLVLGPPSIDPKISENREETDDHPSFFFNPRVLTHKNTQAPHTQTLQQHKPPPWRATRTPCRWTRGRRAAAGVSSDALATMM